MWKLVFPRERPHPAPATAGCPVCGNPHVYKYGHMHRRAERTPLPTRSIQRYRCSACNITWCEYPDDLLPHRHRSRPAQELGVFLYMLGLSYRQAATVLGELGMPASPPTILKDVRASDAEVLSFHQRLRKRTRVLRIPLEDAGTALQERCPRVLIAVNQEDGQGLFVEPWAANHVQEVLGLIFRAVEYWRWGERRNGASASAGPPI